MLPHSNMKTKKGDRQEEEEIHDTGTFVVFDGVRDLLAITLDIIDDTLPDEPLTPTSFNLVRDDKD